MSTLKYSVKVAIIGSIVAIVGGAFIYIILNKNEKQITTNKSTIIQPIQDTIQKNVQEDDNTVINTSDITNHDRVVTNNTIIRQKIQNDPLLENQLQKNAITLKEELQNFESNFENDLQAKEKFSNGQEELQNKEYERAAYFFEETERTLNQAINNPNDNIKIQAKRYYFLGQISELLFKFYEAERYYERLWDLKDERNVLYGSAYIKILWKQKDFNQALNIAQETLSYAQNDAEKAKVFYILGIAYTNIEDIRSAKRSYKRALRIYNRLPSINNADAAATFNKLGGIYNYYDEDSNSNNAITQYNSALNIYRRLPVTYEANVADTLNKLGGAYSKNNNIQQAINHYVEALEIYRRLAEEEAFIYEVNLINILNNLASAYNKDTNYERAIQYYRKALTKIRNLVTENSTSHNKYLLAITLRNLGNVFSYLGETLNDTEDHNDAITLLNESISILKRLYRNNQTAYGYDLKKTYYNLFMTYHYARQPSLAEETRIRTLRINNTRLEESEERILRNGIDTEQINNLIHEP